MPIVIQQWAKPVPQMVVREAGPWGPCDYLIVLFSSNEKACEMKHI
jgi:hypothetical protein